MTAKIIKLPRASRMQCSTCGVTADAACDCGAPYVPVGTRAAEAIARNPEKSNRAIAAELGIGLGTVQRARKSGDPHGSPDNRIGRDGKSYPARRPAEPEPEDDDDDYDDPKLDAETRYKGFLIVADDVARSAFYDGAIDGAIVKAARKAAAAWLKLAERLEKDHVEVLAQH